MIGQLGVRTAKDAALLLLDLWNLFSNQPIVPNEKVVSMIEEHIKHGTLQDILSEKALTEINTVRMGGCCTDGKDLTR